MPPAFAGLSTPARKVVLDPASAGAQGSKKNEGLLLAAAALRLLDVFPMEACAEAIRRGQRGAIADENLAALAASERVGAAREG